MQTSNVDGIWSDDPCPAVKEVYIVRGQRLAIQPLEPADFCAHIVAQNLPVERALGASPAKPFAVSRVLGELGAVDEHLLWHAPANDAGASDPRDLCDGDPRARGGSDPCGTNKIGRAHV